MTSFGPAAAIVSALALAAGAQAGPPAKAKTEARAWGPADVCAIAARPESPGHDFAGDPADDAKANAVSESTDWRMGGWDPKWKIRPEWGPCPIDRVRFDALYFSPDGRFAMTEGGWQAGPIEGAQGYCLFEKRGKAWASLGCSITAMS